MSIQRWVLDIKEFNADFLGLLKFIDEYNSKEQEGRESAQILNFINNVHTLFKNTVKPTTNATEPKKQDIVSETNPKNKKNKNLEKNQNQIDTQNNNN